MTMITDSTRREFLVQWSLVGVGAIGLGASTLGCSSDESSQQAPTTVTPTEPTTPTVVPRVVVLGEEYLLADLLALGITPAASTATVAEAGFQGLDDYDTSDIQVLPGTEPNLELLASLSPEWIVTTRFFADRLGEDTLGGLAKLTVLEDGLSPEQLLAGLGDVFDRKEQATALLAELATARAAAEQALGGLSVSVVAIYPGPSVAAFVAGPWAVPDTLLRAGTTLVPDAAAASPDRNGRAYLSMERLDLLAAPQMVLLQSDLVDGEPEAVEAMVSDPLWRGLPAVSAGEVHRLDRLAYPGAEGEIRLIDDLISALS